MMDTDAIIMRESVFVDARHQYGTNRFHFSPSTITPFIFRDSYAVEPQQEEVIVTGCSELVFQGRMCGDFYAELIGPKFHVSAVNAGAAQALKDALAKIGGAQ